MGCRKTRDICSGLFRLYDTFDKESFVKRRISELLKEKFEYQPDALLLSAENIEGSVRCGQRFGGKFSVSAEPGKLTQGFVYSTNPRLICTPEYFVGQRETFSYEADTLGLQPGSVIEGSFVLCSVAGEYTLPYRFTVEAAKDTKETPRKTLAEFTAMAREDFGRAYLLFHSSSFAALAKSWGPEAETLYQGLAAQTFSYHSLEQFLAGLGLKEPVTVQTEQTHLIWKDPQPNEREELLLLKNTWGFAVVRSTCDAPFLRIERPEVTTEEFVGSTFRLGLIVDCSKLHAGRNFARITVTAGGRSADCVVEVHQKCDPAAQQEERRYRQEILQLMNAYLSWKTGRCGAAELCGISESCLEHLKSMGRTHVFYGLYRAYLAFVGGDAPKAQMLLTEASAAKETLAAPQWKGFSLYLTTLDDVEKPYLEYVKEEISSLYMANQENWMLLWLMLQINGDRFRSDSEKLDAIRRQYICGCKSPVLYLEAWELVKKEPLLLRTLGEFEIHLLGFLCREKLLDREICGQAAQLSARAAGWHPLLYRVLCCCYQEFPDKNTLTSICALLMKGRKTGAQYAVWFELGVKYDVRLAGLYEYYAMTAQDLNVRELPQTVRMYFSYDNTLGYQKKAALYANIIRGRERDPRTFEEYRPGMLRFMEEQIQEGHINEDLALIYEALLTPLLMDGNVAEGLSRILYTHEITCPDPRMHHVIVAHRQLAREQKVQLSGGRACVQCYSDDACILLEGQDGVRYADPSLFARRPLLTRPVFEEYCRRQSSMPEGILLHDCSGICGQMEVTEENEAQLVQFIRLPRVPEAWRKMAQEKLLSYYIEHPRAEHLETFLRQADREALADGHLGELSELLAGEGMSGEALELVRRFGAEQVKPQTLVRLCSCQIRTAGMEEDAQLLALCARCFLQGVYDEAVLGYLLRYYDGPIETMKALWRAGSQFSMEEFSLEEKILVMILYMRQGMEESEPIFEAYLRKQGKARICEAYAAWMSYCYFVREMPVQQPVFDYIESGLGGTKAPLQVCQLALLRRYAFAKELSAGQKKWLYYLLSRFTAQGMYFRFYQRLPSSLMRHFHLHDKYIFEHRGDPASHVSIRVRINGQKEQTLPMINAYEGIFIRTFTLFYQDKVEWSLKIETAHGTEETQTQTFICTRRSHRGSTGRYELLNRMSEAVQKQDKKQLREIREQYIGQEYLAKQLFELNG